MSNKYSIYSNYDERNTRGYGSLYDESIPPPMPTMPLQYQQGGNRRNPERSLPSSNRMSKYGRGSGVSGGSGGRGGRGSNIGEEDDGGYNTRDYYNDILSSDIYNGRNDQRSISKHSQSSVSGHSIKPPSSSRGNRTNSHSDLIMSPSAHSQSSVSGHSIKPPSSSRGNRTNSHSDVTMSPSPSAHSLSNDPTCLSCLQPVMITQDGFEVPIVGGWFHSSCFTCAQCQDEFTDTNPWVPHDGDVYCERDYLALVPVECEACKKPITDGNISYAFGGLAFHQRHLRCYVCRKSIKGKHIEHKGRALCQADYENLVSSTCKSCRGAITDESISALGSIYHRGCFGCTTCQKPFSGSKFYVYEKKAYCLPHYYVAAQAICGGCRKSIQGVCVEVAELSSRYHEDCWRCGVCRDKLTGVYYSYNGMSYCEDDINKVCNFNSSARRDVGAPKKRQTLLLGRR